MNRVSAWLLSHYHWLILMILLILLINLYLTLGNRQQTAGGVVYENSAATEMGFDKMEPCTSASRNDKLKACEIFAKEYQLIKVATLESYIGEDQKNVLIIDAQKRVGSVDCVRYIRRNGEEREKRRHFPNRDTCPPNWDELP